METFCNFGARLTFFMFFLAIDSKYSIECIDRFFSDPIDC